MSSVKLYCKKTCEFIFGTNENIPMIEETTTSSTKLITERNKNYVSKLKRMKKKQSKSIEINMIKSPYAHSTKSPEDSLPSMNLNLKNIKNNISIDDFKLIAILGKGAFGKVKFVKYLRDGKYYAMKVLKKELVRRTKQVDHTKSEKRIMQLIDNDFIVKLFFSFQTAERLYMVMEFMQGGELFFHLKQQRKFNESRAKLYACEIIVALEHLHKNQIIYRDLKPENILLDIHGHLKLTDFGLSKMILDEEDEELELPNLNEKYNNKQSANKLKAFTICGTPEYLCPEILSGKGYDKTVDWWSLGVLIYEMIAGYSPFKNINKNKLDLSSYFKPIKYKNFSEDAESLISGLLQTDYTKRLGYGANDADDLKYHRFFIGINWEDVYNKKLNHSFKPTVNGPEDLRYFDTMFTNESPRESFTTGVTESKFYSKKEDGNYDRFTFVRDD